MARDKLTYASGNSSSTTLSSAITASDTSAPLTADTNFSAKDGEGMVIIDEGEATEELAYATGKSGGALTIPLANRGLEGGSAQGHALSASVKGIISAGMWNDVIDSLTNVLVKSTGAIDTTKVPVAPGTSGNVLTSDGTNWTSAAPSGGTAFWGDVPGTPTRVSDTQFTITDTSNANSYDLLFKKGVILKWLESTTFQTAMVISSSYGTNTVTVNIVGDSLTAGFSAMQYAIPHAQKQTFIIPGTLAAATDIARTFYVPEPMYVLSCDAYVKTAGTTNATEFDVNDDGTSLFGGTAASIASGATSDEDNTAAAPSTAVAEGSLLTIDVNSVSTTAPVEAYIDVWMYPADWRYR